MSSICLGIFDFLDATTGLSISCLYGHVRHAKKVPLSADASSTSWFVHMGQNRKNIAFALRGNDFPVWAADYSLFFATAQNVVVQECASKHEEQEEQENATSFSVVALSFSSQTTLFSPCSLPSRCLLAAFSVTLFFYVCYHHPSSPKHLCYFNPTHTHAQTYKRSTRWA